jgi:voltage-gated potassium channel
VAGTVTDVATPGDHNDAMAATSDIPVWEDLSLGQRRRLLLAQAGRMLLALAGLFTVYFMVPIGPNSATSWSTAAVLALGALVFVAVLARQIRSLGAAHYPVLRAVQAIAILVGLFIVAFALGYLAMSAAYPDAFSESLDKISALYFTVTVLATVGFGDITATNGGARLLVTAQMVLGLGLIGAVVRYVAGQARTIASKRNTPT